MKKKIKNKNLKINLKIENNFLFSIYYFMKFFKLRFL
jgi:hypothetical protein